MTAEPPLRASAETARAGLVDAWLIGVAGVGAVSASLVVAPGWPGVLGAVLAVLTIAIAVVDRRRLIIPDQLNGLAFMAGAIAVCLRPSEGDDIAHALLRAALMFGLFFAFRASYRALRGREGMGLGDVKLAAVAGIWLNWTDLPIAVEIAALSALASVLLGRASGKHWSLTERLPFGLFFAPAVWICWLLAEWRG